MKRVAIAVAALAVLGVTGAWLLRGAASRGDGEREALHSTAPGSLRDT